MSRLDLFIVPDVVERQADPLPVRALGMEAGWWTADGQPGVRAAGLGTGGFSRVRFETHPRAVLYANQQGGFRVQCPVCGAACAEAYAAAVTAWRAGGARTLSCATCGWTGLAEAAVTAPRAALACAAIHLSQVGTFGVDDEALRAISAHWGPVSVVGRRTSS